MCKGGGGSLLSHEAGFASASGERDAFLQVNYLSLLSRQQKAPVKLEDFCIWKLVEPRGLEPLTLALQRRCSPN